MGWLPLIAALVMEGSKSYEVKAFDQDGLWKKVIGELFDDFILFFMPKLQEQIDFTQSIEFLDAELFQEVADEKKGRRHADRLVKVQLKNGKAQWILVHIEIQSSHEKAFSDRMFQYFYRIYDRYDERIVALAVHTSRDSINGMTRFEYDYFGTNLSYLYNNYRTEDYSTEELEQSDNVFSKIVLAAKGLHETKNEMEKRYQFKKKLIHELIQNQQYSRTAVMATLHFVDYLLQLPDVYLKQLSSEIVPVLRKESGLMELYNEENAPPTVLESFGERIERERKAGLERGLEQGLEQGTKQTKVNVIVAGVKRGLDIPTLAVLTGYSEGRVEQIIEENVSS